MVMTVTWDRWQLRQLSPGSVDLWLLQQLLT